VTGKTSALAALVPAPAGADVNRRDQAVDQEVVPLIEDRELVVRRRHVLEARKLPSGSHLAKAKSALSGGLMPT